MYQFTTRNLSKLRVSTAFAKHGTDHQKVYDDSGVSPKTQDTLNVYVSGEFDVSCGDFKQTMSKGQTNFDLTLGKYPAGEVVNEVVSSEWGARICVSAYTGKMQTEVTKMSARQEVVAEHDCLVVLLSGELIIGGLTLLPVSYREVGAKTTIVAGPRGAHFVMARMTE